MKLNDCYIYNDFLESVRRVEAGTYSNDLQVCRNELSDRILNLTNYVESEQVNGRDLLWSMLSIFIPIAGIMHCRMDIVDVDREYNVPDTVNYMSIISKSNDILFIIDEIDMYDASVVRDLVSELIVYINVWLDDNGYVHD